MENPWTAIAHDSEDSSSAKERWIHRLDRPFIADKTVASHLLPEPFIGNPAAPIYLLALNPGYHTDNDQEHQRPEFRKILLQNLLHYVHDWPFYYLNPQFSSTRGGKWWREKFTNLMDEVDDDQTVSRSFFLHATFSLSFRGWKARCACSEHSVYPASVATGYFHEKDGRIPA